MPGGIDLRWQTGLVDHGTDLDALAAHYASALERHGVDSSEAVQWSSRETQERRFQVLAEVVPPEVLRQASVLDFGCGTGHLLTWLRRAHGYEGRYTGYDISPEMIEAARAVHEGDAQATFEHRDVLREGIDGRFDLVLVSGTFNNAVTDAWGFVTDLLRPLAAASDVALAFNALSTYVDYTTDGLTHLCPEDVFRFCKEELSPRVSLRHDYQIKDGVIPFEFTVYVHASDLAPVARLGSTA